MFNYKIQSTLRLAPFFSGKIGKIKNQIYYRVIILNNFKHVSEQLLTDNLT